MFESGLLIAGVTQEGETKLFSTQGADIEAGISGVEADIAPPWRISREQIEAHRADFADNGVIDDPIPAVFSWPGRANRFSEEYNGFSLIGAGTTGIAPFWDEDLDGIYDPDRGDFPILGVRGCQDLPVAPAEMLFYPILLREGDEVAFQVFLTAFRYNCSSAGSAVNNALYLHYKLVNLTGDTFEDSYLGYWADGDIGCFTDDYLGVFPDRDALYFYNAQETDVSCPSDDDLRFIDVPAVVGIDLLRGPLDAGPPYNAVPLSYVMPIQNAALNPGGPPATTEPATIVEYYNYLSGRWRDGQPLLDQGFGYEEGEPANLAFTGDPLANIGWTEVGEENTSGDRKAIFSAGPFRHLPGAVNEFILGITYSQNLDLGHLEQIDYLRNRIDTIQRFFDGCFELDDEGDMCAQLITNNQEVISDKNHRLFLYPNPTNERVSVSLPSQQEGVLRVFAADGQELLQKRTFSEFITLDVQNWPRGLYLLRWEGEQEVFVNKLLVD